ncbi:hypothetical protein [Botrimarina sp.]|uniref:hypothetical protein n=1 Tax=Botrimarina sp. TaxID=2795802 RepID=UPI0032F08780
MSRAKRQALSKIELLGCLIAIGGGVWIGAQYLGLNLHNAAYVALEEADVLQRIPENWRPPNPDCPDGDCPDPEEVRRDEHRRLRAELEQLRLEVAKLTSNEIAVAADASGSLTPADEALRDRTLAYWNSLTQIVFEVIALQERVNPFTGTDYQSRALSVRRRSLEYGENAVALLDTEGVDPEAVSTGVRIGQWFGHAADTLQTALELRTRQPVGDRSMPAADVWAQTEAELGKRTELVRRRSIETAAYLTSRFFVEFPPLGI